MSVKSNAVLFVDFEYRGDDLVVSDIPDLFQWAPLQWKIIEKHQVDLVMESEVGLLSATL